MATSVPPPGLTARAARPRPHGRAKYIAEKCHCDVCRRANSDYEAARTRRRVYGRPTTDLVDAGPARTHVQALQVAGMGVPRIIAAAGVSPATVARLLGWGYRPARRLRPAVAAALLAVRADLAPHALVDAGQTWRRVHGIVAAGYPKVWIARQLGQHGPGLQLGTVRVTRRQADRVAALADQCALTPGPSARARGYAAARGWTVDLLWADLCAPDGDQAGDVDRAAVDRACAGEPVSLTRAERDAAFARLAAAGHSAAEIARRLRMSGSTARARVAAVTGDCGH